MVEPHYLTFLSYLYKIVRPEKYKICTFSRFERPQFFVFCLIGEVKEGKVKEALRVVSSLLTKRKTFNLQCGIAFVVNRESAEKSQTHDLAHSVNL